MPTKQVKDLTVGDRVRIENPDGTAVVKRIKPSQLFRSEGGCFAIDLRIDSGPHKGEWIRDQHHPGVDLVNLA